MSLLKYKSSQKPFGVKASIFTAVYKALHFLSPLPISSLRQSCPSDVGLLIPRANTPQFLCVCSFLCLKGYCPQYRASCLILLQVFLNVAFLVKLTTLFKIKHSLALFPISFNKVHTNFDYLYKVL